MPLDFWKYEGLGNDFILVDARGEATSPRLGPPEARALCDRHRGIGADGVLLIEDPRGDGFARMTVLNADGSTAEMCGNGLRCVARYLFEDGGATVHSLTVETGAGSLPCRIVGDEVEVSLGPVHDEGELSLVLDGQVVSGRRLRLGNPHFVGSAAAGRSDALALGQAAQIHQAFPGGVNVSCRRFIAADHVELHVYERGAGLTLACGTGAGATVAAALLDGTVEPGATVRVTLPGGDLQIRGSLRELFLLGPARRVFRGRLPG